MRKVTAHLSHTATHSQYLGGKHTSMSLKGGFLILTGVAGDKSILAMGAQTGSMSLTTYPIPCPAPGTRAHAFSGITLSTLTISVNGGRSLESGFHAVVMIVASAGQQYGGTWWHSGDSPTQHELTVRPHRQRNSGACLAAFHRPRQ